MKHRLNKIHLSRTSSHVKSLQKNLAANVFDKKIIVTSDRKASILKSYLGKKINTFLKKKSKLEAYRFFESRISQNKSVLQQGMFFYKSVHNSSNGIKSNYIYTRKSSLNGYKRTIIWIQK